MGSSEGAPVCVCGVCARLPQQPPPRDKDAPPLSRMGRGQNDDGPEGAGVAERAVGQSSSLISRRAFVPSARCWFLAKENGTRIMYSFANVVAAGI